MTSKKRIAVIVTCVVVALLVVGVVGAHARFYMTYRPDFRILQVGSPERLTLDALYARQPIVITGVEDMDQLRQALRMQYAYEDVVEGTKPGALFVNTSKFALVSVVTDEPAAAALRLVHPRHRGSRGALPYVEVRLAPKTQVLCVPTWWMLYTGPEAPGLRIHTFDDHLTRMLQRFISRA